MQLHFILDVEHDTGGFGDVVDVAVLVSGERVCTGELDLRLGLD